MPTDFDQQEVSWLQATKRSFDLKDLSTILDMTERKNMFVDHLLELFAFDSNKNEVDELIDEIDRMPTDEFWGLYGMGFG